jgi:hypothetical protein
MAGGFQAGRAGEFEAQDIVEMAIRRPIER